MLADTYCNTVTEWVGVSAEGAYSHEVGPLDLTPALVLLSDFTLKRTEDQDLRNSTLNQSIHLYPAGDKPSMCFSLCYQTSL